MVDQAAKAPLEQIAASLRNERERLGLSLSEVAKRAGIAKSTLSQLEAATGNPSVETLWAIGIALGVPFSRLVDPPKPTITVLRAGEGTVIYSERSSYAATLLSSSPPGARRDIYTLHAEPGSIRKSDPHMPGTTEHFWLGSGRVRLGPSDVPVELGPGDYIAYPGDVPHIFEALEPDTTGVMVLQHM